MAMAPEKEPVAVTMSFLDDLPFVGLMLAVSLGYSLGRLTWRGVSLAPAGGTVFIAVLLGYLGLGHSEPGTQHAAVSVGRFGFCLFIYSVGFEVGPRLFACLKGSLGWRYAALGGVVNLLAVALAIACARLFAFDASTTAGVLSGAITSAATFAAASAEAADPAHLSLAFAITYPFGLIGLVLLIQTLPRLLGEDLSGTEDDEGPAEPGALRPAEGRSPEVTRAYLVQHPGVTRQPLRDLALTRRTGCYVTRIHRGDQVLVADADSILNLGDHLLATGRIDELEAFEGLVGPEVYVEELLRRLPRPRRIHVTRPISGRTLQQLSVMQRFRCLVQSVERGGELIEASGDLALLRGDVVRAIGPRDRLRALAHELGGFEPAEQVTDIAIYSGGILLGLLLGAIEISPGGIDLSLGLAGGLLLSGIVLASLPRVGPLRTGVPEPARQLVRDLGILLFVGETGLQAGRALAAGIDLPWWHILFAGALVTVLPTLAALLVGRRVLRLTPIDAWGSVSGGMTSSAALHAVKQAADSNAPAISYAAAYAVGSVLATVAGQVVVRLLG